MHDAIRTAFDRHGLYENRQAVQIPLAVLAVLGGVFAAWYWIKHSKVRHHGGRHKYLLIARAAVLGMLALVCVRVISWHRTDVYLYRWGLNLLADPGLTLLVGWAALRYRAMTKAP